MEFGNRHRRGGPKRNCLHKQSEAGAAYEANTRRLVCVSRCPMTTTSGNQIRTMSCNWQFTSAWLLFVLCYAMSDAIETRPVRQHFTLTHSRECRRHRILSTCTLANSEDCEHETKPSIKRNRQQVEALQNPGPYRSLVLGNWSSVNHPRSGIQAVA